jgi:methylenetetrahydrofolate reductase (NADPH)
MKVSEAYQAGRLGLSFELFPPKTPAGDQELLRNVEQLVSFSPTYITCTYGAGGSTRQKTLDVISEVRRRFEVAVASHLTCVGSTRQQLRDYLREATAREVENIVALRGDPPQGQETFQPVEGGLRYACDLVELIRAEFDHFGIAVAGYPETHREAPSPEADLENLRCKVAAGADVVITQLFYVNDDFFRFRDRCERVGIRVPIVPGLLPVTNLAQIKRITTLCGAKLPKSFIADLESQGDDAEGQFRVGVEFATAQTQQLIDAQVPGIHFYVLNKSAATSSVLKSVQLPNI